MKKLMATALISTAAHHAWAHGGHGMAAAIHWHASDFAGLAVVVAGAMLALWLSRNE
jgi:hypothetical protein